MMWLSANFATTFLPVLSNHWLWCGLANSSWYVYRLGIQKRQLVARCPVLMAARAWRSQKDRRARWEMFFVFSLIIASQFAFVVVVATTEPLPRNRWSFTSAKTTNQHISHWFSDPRAGVVLIPLAAVYHIALSLSQSSIEFDSNGQHIPMHMRMRTQKR